MSAKHTNDAASLSLREALVEHAPFLLGLATRLAANRDDAADLLQDTIETALRSGPSSEMTAAKWRAWLSVVLRNRFLDHWRHVRVVKRLHRNECSLIAEESLSNAAGDLPLARWRSVDTDRLSQAIDCLPSPFRGPLVLALQGVPTLEISRRLGVPLSTVGTRLFRARLRLREMLAPAAPRPRGVPVLSLLRASASSPIAASRGTCRASAPEEGTLPPAAPVPLHECAE